MRTSEHHLLLASLFNAKRCKEGIIIIVQPKQITSYKQTSSENVKVRKSFSGRSRRYVSVQRHNIHGQGASERVYT